MRRALIPLFAGSRSLDLPAGEAVFLTGQQVEMLYILRTGRVQLQRHTTHGARLILQNAGPEAVLAEASAFSEHYHCDAVVTEPTTLAALPKPVFIAALRDDPDLALAWSAKARARGYRTTRNFINMAYLVAGRLKRLPASPYDTKCGAVVR